MQFDRFLSIPFKSQGRDRDGCDCWGLVCLYYQEALNIRLTSFAETPAHAFRDVAGLIARERLKWRSVDTPALNDVVLMRIADKSASRLVAHVGLAVDGRRMLHTQEDIGPRIERLDAPHIKPKIMEYRRYQR